MTAQLIDGKKISQGRLQLVSAAVTKRLESGWRAPCLAVVLVGDNPASAVYVRNKKSACQKCGIRSLSYELPASTSQEDLLKLVDELNGNAEVDGILVQLPLPEGLDSQAVLERIHPDKDVDGFHPYNVGRLVVKMPLMRPCTPKGVMTLPTIRLVYISVDAQPLHKIKSQAPVGGDLRAGRRQDLRQRHGRPGDAGDLASPDRAHRVPEG